MRSRHEATTVRLMDTEYIITLYEAKTAEPVGRIEVPGLESCPEAIPADSPYRTGE